MYLECTTGYDSDGAPTAKGLFLMVFEDPESKKSRPEIRACVRFVKMEQLGNWMMGTAKIASHEIVLSGSYGSDGLPMYLRHKNVGEKVASHIWEHLVQIPKDLQEKFWEGGGHNCAGSEGPHFHKWGKENIKVLRKPIQKLKETTNAKPQQRASAG
jgi:hypothetical protein